MYYVVIFHKLAFMKLMRLNVINTTKYVYDVYITR